MIQATIRQLLLGLDDDEYAALDDEIELWSRRKSQAQRTGSRDATRRSRRQASATEGDGSDEQFAGEDPTGQSGGTAVTGIIPGVM